MPATRPVSLIWQIVFVFLPILNIWVFYRIRKLQKYLAWVIAPQLLAIALIGYTSSPEFMRIVNPPLGLLWPDPNITISSVRGRRGRIDY